MSDQDHGPKRLFDELDGGDLRDLLAAGKSEQPTDHQMVALAAKLGIAGAIGGIGGAGAAGGGAAGGGAAGGGAAGGGAAGAGAKAAVATGAVKSALAVKVVGAVAIVGAVGATTVAVTSQPHVEDTKPSGIVASASAPIATSAQPTNVNLPPRPDPFASASASPSPSASVVTPIVKPSTSAPLKAEDEVKMLERAQDALKNRPEEALAIANEHARAYPNGMLAQEREVIAIEALVKSGRRADAVARADKFKARYPGSSHTRRIDSLLAR